MADDHTTGPEPCALERLAEHLAARRLGDWNDTRLVADWLDYSLDRCGLVVVEEQSLATRQPQSPSTSEAARVELLLKYALEAIETGRSEPLFIARDAIRNYFNDRNEALKSKEQSK